MQVGLHDGLNILAIVIQVAHTIPTFASVIMGAEAVAVFCCPFLGVASVIVAHDVCRHHLVGHTVIGLSGEIHPVADVLAVVDHHIGNCSDTFFLKCLDQGAQFCLITEGAVIVLKPIEVIVSHRSASAVGTLWNPYQIEGGSQFIGLFLQACPLGIVIRIPEESL